MTSLKNIPNLEERLYLLAEKYDTKEEVAKARKLMQLMIEIDKKIDLYHKFTKYMYLNLVKPELIKGIITSLAYKRTGNINYINSDYAGWALEIRGNYSIIGNKNLKFGVISGNIKLLGYKSGYKADFYDNTLVLGYKSGELAVFHDFSEAGGYESGFGGIFYDFSKASGPYSGKYGIFYNNSEACGYKSGYKGFFYDMSVASGSYSGFEGYFKNYSSATGFQAGERGIYKDNTKASGTNSGKEGKFYDESSFISESNAGINSTIYRDNELLISEIISLPLKPKAEIIIYKEEKTKENKK